MQQTAHAEYIIENTFKKNRTVEGSYTALVPSHKEVQVILSTKIQGER